MPKSQYRQPLVGTCYLHTVIDDHSRVAYVEAHEDETKETATAVLRNAVAWFAQRGVIVRRVISDKGSCYKSRLCSESARLAALPARVREYNHHRPHSAIGKAAPITRLDNLAGHHI